MSVAILIRSNEIWCRLPDLNGSRNTFFYQFDKIFAVRLCVYISIYCADIARFINNKGRPVRSLKSFHDAAVDLADRKFGISKQRESKLFCLLKFLMRGFVIDADSQKDRICPLNLAQLIPERAEFCRSAAGEIFGIKC